MVFLLLHPSFSFNSALLETPLSPHLPQRLQSTFSLSSLKFLAVESQKDTGPAVWFWNVSSLVPKAGFFFWKFLKLSKPWRVIHALISCVTAFDNFYDLNSNFLTQTYGRMCRCLCRPWINMFTDDMQTLNQQRYHQRPMFGFRRFVCFISEGL